MAIDEKIEFEYITEGKMIPDQLILGYIFCGKYGVLVYRAQLFRYGRLICLMHRFVYIHRDR